MLELKVDEAGILNLIGSMEKSLANIKDMRPAWHAISPILSEEFERLFNAEGAYQGPKWSRLAPATVKTRTHRGLIPIQIGSATGRMKHSLADAQHPDAVEKLGRDRYIRSTKVTNRGFEYRLAFEFGGGNSRGVQQPARPIGDRLIHGRKTLGRLLEAFDEALFGHMGDK